MGKEEKLGECVEQAATVLDEMYPTWFQAINQSELDMGSTIGCVLGQMGGQRGSSYSEMFRMVTERADEMFSTNCVTIAFDLGYLEESVWHDDWQTLERCWVEQIEERKFGDHPAVPA